MSFFDWYFSLAGDKTEEFVLCPFPHKRGGVEYYESNPSAQVNTEERLFHCKTCDEGHNEASFMAKVLGTTMANAHRLIPKFKLGGSVFDWDKERPEIQNGIPIANSFNISTQVQNELKLTTTDGMDMSIPVFMFDKLIDVRTYRPNTTPKCRSQVGAVNGIIIPFDHWVHTKPERWTIVCAGEKDMAVTRSKGFNAISITGGEQKLPLTPAVFKDRLIAICYDNDDAGRKGAKKLASFLNKHGAKVKVVEKFHEDMEDKEDLTDYFNKYGKEKKDLITCLEATDFYVGEDDYYDIPKVNLYQASLPQYTGRLVKANIQVVAVSDQVFTMPGEIIGEKLRSSQQDTEYSMRAGETRVWALDEDTVGDVLHLVDGRFKEKQLNENYRKLTGVPFKERNVAFRRYGKYTVYKATVTDLYETSSESDHLPMEYLVYSINNRLESGKKYTATFRVIPHPYEGQQLVMVLWSLDQANDSISSFSLTDQNKSRLRVFQEATEEMGIEGMIEDSAERVKGLLGYDGNTTLIKTMDLAYHTPLQFHMGKLHNMRAYLDTIIVGESRMGKSSTAEALREAYGLGTFVSLAGNSATIPGLVGGSNKVGTGYQTKAGLIPQNHKGLMIFEEFGKCKSDVISELTDIRSSNEVRIARVSGALTLPAMVRMISLSNVKTLNSKEIRSIASYPHGVAIVTELVGSAEDIARYDIMLVSSYKGTSISDPYWEPATPYPLEYYRTRIRWIWSRDAEQVVIPETVGHYISEQANQLNKDFDTHIKIFGTEAWKKLARLAIAVAGYCVSTDEDFQNIIVRKEHVDYAVEYMKSIYDNPTFRLKEYVEHERKYSTTDEDSKYLLQTIYTAAPGVILHLEQEHKTSKGMLSAASGVSSEQLNTITNQLIRGMFIKLSGNDIIPTERFRLTVPYLDRSTITRRVGEINGSH